MVSKNRIQEIDALRGIAALSVVLFHFTMDRPQSALGFRLGVTGVDLFFIISGFVIFLTLENTRTLKDFIISRFSRIYPVYWACATLTSIFIVLRLENPEYPGFIARYLANLTMLQTYAGFPHLDGAYWTLLVELQFYVVMALVFHFRWLKAIEKIGLGLLGVSVVVGLLNPAGLSPIYEAICRWIPLLSYIPLFLSGIIFYKLKFGGSSIRRYAILTVCFLSQLLHFPFCGTGHYYVSFHEYSAILAVYCAVFILYVHGKLGFLVNKATLFLGTISYPLYLIHQYIGYSILLPELVGKRGWTFWNAVSFSLVLVVVVASMMTFLVEKPFLRFIRNKYLSRRGI